MAWDSRPSFSLHGVTFLFPESFVSAADPNQDSTYRLQAALPDWCALRWHHAAICLLFAVLFLYFSYLPIPTQQIWENVWSGNWIANNGYAQLDLTLPLAEGTRNASMGWWGQVAVAKIHSLGGPKALTISFAVLQTIALSLWGFVLFQTGRRWWAIVSVPAIALGCLHFLVGVQPSLIGQIIFAAMICCLLAPSATRTVGQRFKWQWRSASWVHWLTIGGLFVLWVNADVSFVIGLALVGILALSRLIDQGRGLVDVPISCDKELWRRTWLFELLLVLTLVQPLGWKLWQSMLWWPDNSLIMGFGGWSSLTVASWSGVTVAIVWAIWIACSRYTDRVPTWSILAAVCFSALVAVCQFTLVWFALVMLLAAFSMLPMPAVQTRTASSFTDENRPLRFGFTLVCGLMIWVAFSLSPLGTMALGGNETPTEKLFNRTSPLAAAKFLQENRPAGLVFAPSYWSDWLQTGDDLIPVFANSNYLIQPVRVNQDYTAIYSAESHWKRLLDRYAVTDLIVDKENQPDLARALRKAPGQWEKQFEDDISVVYRKERG